LHVSPYYPQHTEHEEPCDRVLRISCPCPEPPSCCGLCILSQIRDGEDVRLHVIRSEEAALFPTKTTKGTKADKWRHPLGVCDLFPCGLLDRMNAAVRIHWNNSSMSPLEGGSPCVECGNDGCRLAVVKRSFTDV
jgi:hypothetical protein